jgi:hypothetical protein
MDDEDNRLFHTIRKTSRDFFHPGGLIRPDIDLLSQGETIVFGRGCQSFDLALRLLISHGAGVARGLDMEAQEAI